MRDVCDGLSLLYQQRHSRSHAPDSASSSASDAPTSPLGPRTGMQQQPPSAQVWSCTMCAEWFSDARTFLLHVAREHEEVAVSRDGRVVTCSGCMKVVVGAYYAAIREPLQTTVGVDDHESDDASAREEGEGEDGDISGDDDDDDEQEQERTEATDKCRGRRASKALCARCHRDLPAR